MDIPKLMVFVKKKWHLNVHGKQKCISFAFRNIPIKKEIYKKVYKNIPCFEYTTNYSRNCHQTEDGCYNLCKNIKARISFTRR